MDITVILPIHKWDDKVKELYEKAIETVKEQDGDDDRPKVLVVYAAALESNEDFKKNFEQEYDALTVTFLKNEGKIDFQSQINLAAKEVKTRWFSILEFDDEYSTTYFKIMKSYIDSPEFKDIDIFLPIIVETNDKEQALKLTNETVWSKQFVGENGTMGYLNENSLNQYTDFKICGSLIKTDEFNESGGLKTNIKLTFQYEFLLRYLKNASKIYTVPKIGYKHLSIREGSLFDTISKTMSLEERKFWFETAKKEANFFNDRPIDLSFQKKPEQTNV
jgi:hypothetical protein